MKIITITIPGPPIARQRPRRSANGGMYDAQDKEMIVLKRSVRSQCPQSHIIPDPKIPIIVNVTAFVEPARTRLAKKGFAEKIKNEDHPHLQKPDKDNYLKTALDICSGIIYHDDAQIYDGRTSKYWSTNPRMEIEIIIEEEKKQ